MKKMNHWEKIRANKIKMRRETMSEHLVVGHELINLHQDASDYYVGFGGDNDLLVALLPVKDMNTHGYYATGKGYSAVFLKDADNTGYAGDSPFNKLPEYQKFCDEHPVILYFLGCDDGSYGKQFKSKEDALDFLKNVKSFDEMVDSNDGPAIYNAYVKSKEVLTPNELKSIFENSLLYIN